MKAKITAAMLLATALPFSQVYAHSVSVELAPVTGYKCFMLSVGAAYSVFLLVRMYRKRNQDQIHSSNNKTQTK